MTSYDECNSVAARSLALLIPFLEEFKGRFVVTDKGPLARYLQSVVGDLIYNNSANKMWTVELKADDTDCKNIYIETWSNRNLDIDTNRELGGRKPGWFLTLNADLLFYHFLKQDRLVTFSLPALQRWGFCKESRNWSEPDYRGERTRLQGRLWDFRETKQKQWNQKNDTWGRPVPVATLLKEVVPTPKIYSVRQLSLDIFGVNEGRNAV
jgi:hypothetical protein